MTVKEMESRVRVDWLESGQTRYRVIDRAVFDRTKDSHTWETRHPKTGQPQTLHVDFVAA
ncbi:MAG: hypothetical protein MRY21_05410 [Simkaniaceae bacterium]|nr:hypothetical protein [Simkaniaceae bacterium]